MPVHQITVVPARENGQSAQDGKDQGSEGKPPARSGSRSSTVSKAGNLAVAAGPTGGASKTSITPSSQDICSMTVPGATLAPPPPKKQVKRRRRHRKRSGYGPLDCTGAKERDPERRPPDRPSRLLCLDSTSEDERPAAARSWSREKSRRARRRQRGRTPDDVTEVMELQSLGSDEAKGGAPPSPPEAAKTPDESQTSSPGADKAPASSPSSEETLTTSYRETGAGPEDTAETQKGRGVNGAPPLALLSDDSETEDLPLRRRRGVPADHALPLHGQPELRAPRLPLPVDQVVGHEMLRALQFPFCHGDHTQAVVPVGGTTHDQKREEEDLLLGPLPPSGHRVHALLRLHPGQEDRRGAQTGEKRHTGVALLDQVDRGVRRLLRRPGFHVRPVQDLPAALAPPRGLQPHHHRAELPRQEPARRGKAAKRAACRQSRLKPRKQKPARRRTLWW
ncbi:uncharacterized protein marchf1 isoform X3 [Stigmatopora nigra]